MGSGTGAPYVDLAVPGVEEEMQKTHAALLVAQEEEGRDELTLEEIDAKFRAAFALQREVERPHLALRARLTGYLIRFYADRHVSFHQRLVIQGEVVQGIGCPVRYPMHKCRGLSLSRSLRREAL